jgi:AMP phosphorylase
MKKVVLKTNGAIVWGGGLNLAAADDYLIAIRKPLKIDPRGMLLASIMAKKKAVGAEYVLIDIPVGKGAKVDTEEKAKELSTQFIELGGRLGMMVQTIITDGSAPIGKAVGPALEAQDALMVLENRSESLDLREKTCRMVGLLLEAGGKAEVGEGYSLANKIIDNGKAIAKFRDIIEAQGGDPKIKAEDIPVGQYKHMITANEDSRIHSIDNTIISEIARVAGAPKCKGAGIKLFVEVGDKVRKGAQLFEIYAESEAKLDQAIEVFERAGGFTMGKVILESFTGKRIFEISKISLEE